MGKTFHNNEYEKEGFSGCDFKRIINTILDNSSQIHILKNPQLQKKSPQPFTDQETFFSSTIFAITLHFFCIHITKQ